MKESKENERILLKVFGKPWKFIKLKSNLKQKSDDFNMKALDIAKGIKMETRRK